MKISSIYVRSVAVLLGFSFAMSARAEAPREELVHSYRLLKHADHDYGGHREEAMKEIEAAGKKLGLALEGDADKKEQQWKSDEKLTRARRLLRDARKKLEKEDRDRAAAEVDAAIKEIDIALKIK